MALDTAAKRKSAIHVGSPWRGCLPFPDGTIAVGDRATTVFMYSGLIESVEPVVVVTPFCYAPARSDIAETASGRIERADDPRGIPDKC